MSWDWSTTRAVLDARVQCSVYPELPTPEDALKSRLLAELERFLEPVLGKGARLHPEDVEVRTVPDAAGYLLVQMRWMPSVQTVELLGGYHDGLVVAVPEPLGLHGLKLPDPADRPLPLLYDTAVYPEVSVTTYHLNGWNNVERRWVFSRDGAR